MQPELMLHFHGAAHTVTGSCQLLEIGNMRILVDCGMFQGSKSERELNYRPFPFDARTISAVILTHAHIDHSGLLPKLVKAGFTGPIHATPGTRDLAAVMLPDSGHIQESEVENLNRRNLRRGKPEVEPIYTAEDAMETMKQFRTLEYNTWQTIGSVIRFRFSNAGHLLGSASVELEAGEAEDKVRILFSGDIGPANKLFEVDPVAPSGFHYLICESTYGDEDRLDVDDDGRRKLLLDEIRAATNPNGALIIPSFAVERTQELLADIYHLIDTGAIPACPIYIDSPLATRASEIFQKHAREMQNGGLLTRALSSHNVRFTETAEQSKALDRLHGFHVVIAASGMCDAGRIRHRLRNWLWRSEGTVMLVGYQANGTLGRILEDGAPVVKIQGDEIKVRARIRKLDLYSGHADGPELKDWIAKRAPVTSNIFLVHGEENATDGLQARLSDVMANDKIIQPTLDSSFRLTLDGAIDVTEKGPPPRIQPVLSGKMDWHNDIQALLLDINEELAKAADHKARAVVIRKLRRALSEPSRSD